MTDLFRTMNFASPKSPPGRSGPLDLIIRRGFEAVQLSKVIQSLAATEVEVGAREHSMASSQCHRSGDSHYVYLGTPALRQIHPDDGERIKCLSIGKTKFLRHGRVLVLRTRKFDDDAEMKYLLINAALTRLIVNEVRHHRICRLAHITLMMQFLPRDHPERLRGTLRLQSLEQAHDVVRNSISTPVRGPARVIKREQINTRHVLARRRYLSDRLSAKAQ